MMKQMQLQKDQYEGQAAARGTESAPDADKEAWESALESLQLATPLPDVASEDGAGGAAGPSPEAWSEESRQKVRARLEGLQDKLNKAMDELNAKMAATKNLSAEEAARLSAEGQKRLAEWQAHPDHRHKR